MRDFLLILRIRLDEALNISRTRYSGRSRDRIESFGFLLMRILIFCAVFCILYALCAYLGRNGLAEVLPTLFYSISFTVSFLLTIVNMNELITGNEDSEFLLSTPVSEFSHVFVLFLTLYVKSLVPVVLLCVPAVTVYADYTVLSAFFWVRWVLGVLLTSLPMGGIGALAGMAITLTLAENPNKNRIQSGIALFFTFIGVVLIIFLIDRIGLVMLRGLGSAQAEICEKILATLTKNSLFSRFYQHAVIEGSGPYLFIFTLVSLIWYLAIAMLVGLSYRIMTISLRCPVHYKLYEWREQKQRSVEKALMQRERNLFFGSKSYMTKSLIGVIVGILLPLNFCIISPTVFLSIFSLEHYLLPISRAVPCLICFFVALSCTSYCAFSIEGKRFWISETAPVDRKLLRRCKVRLNLSVTVPFALLSAVLCIVAFRPAPALAAAYILIPLIYAVISACWGIFIDSRFGDCSRESESQAMHQGASYLLGYLPGLLIPVIAAAIII